MFQRWCLFMSDILAGAQDRAPGLFAGICSCALICAQPLRDTCCCSLGSLEFCGFNVKDHPDERRALSERCHRAPVCTRMFAILPEVFTLNSGVQWPPGVRKLWDAPPNIWERSRLSSSFQYDKTPSVQQIQTRNYFSQLSLVM